jgi:type VI secretion system secreted protein Hcp
MNSGNWLAIGLLAMAGAGSSGAEAASDYRLQLDGLPGVIEVVSFSVGAGVPAQTAVGARGVARSSHGPSSIHFSARTGPAASRLAEANARGTHVPTATLEVFKTGGAAAYLRYKMTDVMVSSFQVGGSSGRGGEPLDRFVLNFSKVDLEYLQQPASAGPGAASAASLKAGGVVAAMPGTITAVKVQPAAANAGAPVTITVEGTGECQVAWIDFGDHSQPQAQLFASPFPKTFVHAFASPGTFTVVGWGYDPDAPKQKTEVRPGTCVGRKTATVQVRSLMTVAPALKK